MSKMAGSDARRASKLGRAFYTRADALRIARELLGKRLVVPSPTGERVSGRIVEVEAYLGVGGKASHASGLKTWALESSPTTSRRARASASPTPRRTRSSPGASGLKATLTSAGSEK